MNNQPVPTCGPDHTARIWQLTTFEYREGDIMVQVPNVYGWVCPVHGEVSFTPETVDMLIETVRALVNVGHPLLSM